MGGSRVSLASFRASCRHKCALNTRFYAALGFEYTSLSHESASLASVNASRHRQFASKARFYASLASKCTSLYLKSASVSLSLSSVTHERPALTPSRSSVHSERVSLYYETGVTSAILRYSCYHFNDMARRLRVEVEGGLYHLIARGNDRQDIFHSHEDRQRFLALLLKEKVRSPFFLYAYCLMTNHIHLLLERQAETIGSLRFARRRLYFRFR